MPIIVVATRGAKSGKVRKLGLMRVEKDGEYALVASKGGMPENPEWYHNLVAHPDEVTIQDGPEPFARPRPRGLRRREAGVVGARRWRRTRPTPSTRRTRRARSPSSSPRRSAPEPGASSAAAAKASTMAMRQGMRLAYALERGLAEAHHDEVEGRADGDRLALVARGAEGAERVVARQAPPVRTVRLAVLVRRDHGAAVVHPAGRQQPYPVPHAVAQVEQSEAGPVAGRGAEDTTRRPTSPPRRTRDRHWPCRAARRAGRGGTGRSPRPGRPSAPPRPTRCSRSPTSS